VITAASGTGDPTGTVSWSYCYKADEFPTVTSGGPSDISCTDGVITGIAGHSGAEADEVNPGTAGDRQSSASLINLGTPLPAGYYIFIATYSGDSNYAASFQTAGLTITPAPPPVTGCLISIEGEAGLSGAFDLASSDVNGIEVTFAFTGTRLYLDYVNEIAPENNLNGVTLVPQLSIPNVFYWTNPGSSSQSETWRIYDPTNTTLLCELVVTYLPANRSQAPGGSGSSTKDSNYFVAEGFGKGKAKLTRAMKSFISEQLEARAGEKRVVCTGTVRGRAWNPKREALALARAKAGCDYVRTLLPEVPVELKKRLISKPKGNPLTVRIRAFY
jgi:hypothetical protein